MLNWAKAFRAVICASALVLAGQTQAAIVEISAILTGAQEIPGPGDPDGFGLATFQIDDAANLISGLISFEGLDEPLTGLHIHIGAAGIAGPIVIPFAFGNGTSPIPVSAFVPDPSLNHIAANPSQFYLNIHTTAFRAGAIRGQLFEGRVPEPGTLLLVTMALLMVPILKKRAS